MTPTVFIHTNARQTVGAQVARYALKRNSRAPERFDVRIIDTAEFPFIASHHGRRYLRGGRRIAWNANDLQSFTPLRFAVPELQSYSGRAVLIDPDIFAVGDINELLDRNMQGASVLARPEGVHSRQPAPFVSSVMLLDCAKLKHWQLEADFEKLFRFDRDYRDWNRLMCEPPGSVAPLETVWNDFDRLAPDTRLLHNTKRRTQPWKTGLPAEFVALDSSFTKRIGQRLRRAGNLLGLRSTHNGVYRPHPDRAQERLFFQLVGECLDRGIFTCEFLEDEIGKLHLRRDAFACIDAARKEAVPVSAGISESR